MGTCENHEAKCSPGTFIELLCYLAIHQLWTFQKGPNSMVWENLHQISHIIFLKSSCEVCVYGLDQGSNSGEKANPYLCGSSPLQNTTSPFTLTATEYKYMYVCSSVAISSTEELIYIGVVVQEKISPIHPHWLLSGKPISDPHI